MIDTPTTPPVDNQWGGDDYIKMEARITKLEANGESSAKLIEAMQLRMDEGFKNLRAELHLEIASVRNEISGLRNEMRIEISQLRSEVTAIRQDMNTNFRWFMGIQTTTIFALIGVGARALNLF